MESLTSDNVTAAFQSPLADAQLKLAATTSFASSLLSRYVEQFNVWTGLLTLILLAITYDQCAQETYWKHGNILIPVQVVTNGRNGAL